MLCFVMVLVHRNELLSSAVRVLGKRQQSLFQRKLDIL